MCPSHTEFNNKYLTINFYGSYITLLWTRLTCSGRLCLLAVWVVRRGMRAATHAAVGRFAALACMYVGRGGREGEGGEGRAESPWVSDLGQWVGSNTDTHAEEGTRLVDGRGRGRELSGPDKQVLQIFVVSLNIKEHVHTLTHIQILPSVAELP